MHWSLCCCIGSMRQLIKFSHMVTAVVLENYEWCVIFANRMCVYGHGNATLSTSSYQHLHLHFYLHVKALHINCLLFYYFLLHIHMYTYIFLHFWAWRPAAFFDCYFLCFRLQKWVITHIGLTVGWVRFLIKYYSTYMPYIHAYMYMYKHEKFREELASYWCNIHIDAFKDY